MVLIMVGCLWLIVMFMVMVMVTVTRVLHLKSTMIVSYWACAPNDPNPMDHDATSIGSFINSALFLTNCLAPRPLISIASLHMNDMNISTHIHCVIDIHWKNNYRIAWYVQYSILQLRRHHRITAHTSNCTTWFPICRKEFSQCW